MFSSLTDEDIKIVHKLFFWYECQGYKEMDPLFQYSHAVRLLIRDSEKSLSSYAQNLITGEIERLQKEIDRYIMNSKTKTMEEVKTFIKIIQDDNFFVNVAAFLQRTEDLSVYKDFFDEDEFSVLKSLKDNCRFSKFRIKEGLSSLFFRDTKERFSTFSKSFENALDHLLDNIGFYFYPPFSLSNLQVISINGINIYWSNYFAFIYKKGLEAKPFTEPLDVKLPERIIRHQKTDRLYLASGMEIVPLRSFAKQLRVDEIKSVQSLADYSASNLHPLFWDEKYRRRVNDMLLYYDGEFFSAAYIPLCIRDRFESLKEDALGFIVEDALLLFTQDKTYCFNYRDQLWQPKISFKVYPSYSATFYPFVYTGRAKPIASEQLPYLIEKAKAGVPFKFQDFESYIIT